MKLRPIDEHDLDRVTRWLSLAENGKWLDLGSSGTAISPAMLKFMSSRPSHDLQLVELPGQDEPIGLVAYGDIHMKNRTANLWYVLGDKEFAGRNLMTRAVSLMLTRGFSELNLKAVQAWAVHGNIASIRVLEKNHFSPVGTQRRCHCIDMQWHDRHLYDLLAAEHHGHAPKTKNKTQQTQSHEYNID